MLGGLILKAWVLHFEHQVHFYMWLICNKENVEMILVSQKTQSVHYATSVAP